MIAAQMISGETAISIGGAAVVCYTIGKWAWSLAAKLTRIEDAIARLEAEIKALKKEIDELTCNQRGRCIELSNDGHAPPLPRKIELPP